MSSAECGRIAAGGFSASGCNAYRNRNGPSYHEPTTLHVKVLQQMRRKTEQVSYSPRESWQELAQTYPTESRAAAGPKPPSHPESRRHRLPSHFVLSLTGTSTSGNNLRYLPLIELGLRRFENRRELDACLLATWFRPARECIAQVWVSSGHKAMKRHNWALSQHQIAPAFAVVAIQYHHRTVQGVRRSIQETCRTSSDRRKHSANFTSMQFSYSHMTKLQFALRSLSSFLTLPWSVHGVCETIYALEPCLRVRLSNLLSISTRFWFDPID